MALPPPQPPSTASKRVSNARSIAATLLVALMASSAPQGVHALCRCYCGNNYWTTYNECTAGTCQYLYGTCPPSRGGWLARNQNPSIIGGTVGGFFVLLFFITLCVFCMRRRRRRGRLFLASGGPVIGGIGHGMGPRPGSAGGNVYGPPPPMQQQQQQQQYTQPTPYDAHQHQQHSQQPLLFPEPGHSASDLHDRRNSNASFNGQPQQQQQQYPQYPPPAGPPPQPQASNGGYAAPGRPSTEDIGAPPPAYRA